MKKQHISENIKKTCDYIEMGSCFQPEGIRTCVHGTYRGPLIATKEELAGETITYEKIVARRNAIIENINSENPDNNLPCLTCSHLKRKNENEIDTSHLGGKKLTAGLNIQHYTACNQRCTYCTFTINDNWIKPQYDPIKYFEIFKENGKLRGNNWIDFSGGETSLLKDFDRILNFIIDNDLGAVVVYTNATTFKQSLFDALKNNKSSMEYDRRVILTTSLETGIPSTYNKIRARNDFEKVIANLIRYKSSGSKNIWLKYIITPENETEDDLWSFIFAMCTIKPERVLICPEFYGNKQKVPQKTVEFAAKLWCLVENIVQARPIDYTMDFGSTTWEQYHKDLAAAIKIEQKRQETIGISKTT